MAQGRLASHKKGASRSGAAVAFVDETGHSFRARLATTWALVGHPPDLKRTGRLQRELSSCGALVVPLHGQRARLYARHYHGSIHGEQVVEALRYFRRKVGRPLVIVWDKLQAHRSCEVSDFIQRHPQDFRIEWLPPYAPDLNPEEGCNSMVKSDTRNFSGDSERELRAAVRASFMRVGRQPETLRSFCEHAGLRLN